MTRRIIPLDGSPDGLLDRLRAVRAAGDVPLVGDECWPATQWSQVRELAAAEPVPKEAAWASLTSGSSGTPRIVLRTAASWADSFAAVSAILAPGGDAAEQRILLPAPPASSLTLFSLAHALAGGPRPVLPGSAEAADATVFGLPSDGIGALVAALVELDPGVPSPSARELRTMAASRFATAHRPRVWFTGTLARTATGKPARAEALRRALAGEGVRRA
ncbi:MAG: hypothetical protein L0H74_13045 [Brachybacterium sp.]|nr:hypothetical protein [Brachybacterium sp.]MDN5900982.1 hypothetical protein [Brachybacterium sp.]